MNIYIWIFVGMIVVLAAALVIVGLRNRQEETPFDERLNEYIARGEEVTLEEIELSQPITERIIVPIVEKIGELTEKFTPQNAIEQTEKKLELAGNPPGIDPTIFWACEIYCGSWCRRLAVIRIFNGIYGLDLGQKIINDRRFFADWVLHATVIAAKQNYQPPGRNTEIYAGCTRPPDYLRPGGTGF